MNFIKTKWVIYLKHALSLPFFLLFNISIVFCSQDSLILDLSPKQLTDTRPLSTLPNIGVWIDSLHLGFEEGINNKTYSPLDSNYQLENLAHNYWFRFSLDNETTAAKNYWLNTSVFDSLTLIHVTPQGINIQHRGLLIAYDQLEKNRFKSLEEHKYGFQLHLKPQSSTVFYLRIKNLVRFESTLEQISLMEKANQNPTAIIWNLIFNCVFVGILAFLALFSLLQFFQNKDLAYFFYFLYLTTCNIYMWWKFEKANSFVNLFFTNSPEWYYFLETPTYLAIYASYLLFLIHFIDAKKDIPFFYKLIKITIFSIPAYLLLDRILIHFMGFSFSWELYFIFRVVLVTVGLMTLYFVFKSKVKLAIYLLSGSFVVLIGNCITAYFSKTMTQHYWNSWDIPLVPIQIAILIEVFLFSIGLGYKSRLVERERTKILQNLKIERKEKENQKKQKEQLTDWFSNVSHEFRTPLTVINGLTNQIQEQPNFKITERIGLIKNNTKNLLELINQLLDLSKLEAGHIFIQNKQQNIIPYLRFLTESFQSIAFDKKIMLSFNAKETEFWMDFDAEKIRRIVINLLSNALKFTPEYGKINIVVDKLSKKEMKQKRAFNNANDHLMFPKTTTSNFKEMKRTDFYFCIKVKDTGIGIAPEQLESIFDRFFQSDYKNAFVGTGLGLALTKELVLLMNGQLEVESTPKKGSTFSIFLPITNNALIEQDGMDLIIKNEPKTTLDNNEEVIGIKSKERVKNQLGKPLLLIVEDNQDVIYYLKACIGNNYQIVEANNGIEGRDLAFEHIPDIILSDVMMPEMDGYELCSILKNDARTSHIPIILLTAKATTESKHKGLEMRADAYLIKPFDKKELLLRLENLLLLKKQMQLHLQLNTHLSSTKSTTTSSIAAKEIAFLDQLKSTTQQQLANEFFKAPQLAKAMAMSQTQLYRKIKALTNQSTGQYIKTIRLNAAKHLLETTDYSIGQIATEVGFKTQAHFTRSFQEMFVQNPSKFRK